MPRGYVLDSTYDAKRAIFRKIYSNEIKNFSGIIKDFSYYNTGAYALIIGKLNDGIYDNLDKDLYQKTVFGINGTKTVGENKSSNSQDFMSPKELRMNAIAVRRVVRAISKQKHNMTLTNIMDASYNIGCQVAYEFSMLSDENESDMQVKSPVLSSKPIVKKYIELLKLGTLPEEKALAISEQELVDKNELIALNLSAFADIKERLTQLGVLMVNERKNIFSTLNAGYYELSTNGTMEITALILNEQDRARLSIEELKSNYEKLDSLRQVLYDTRIGTSYEDIRRRAYAVGARAREFALAKYRKLPELYSGFYKVYTIGDKEFMEIKENKENRR
ncbi:MAG: hypothetical protein J6T74_09815 [Clostridia bacterium]|nr:hypothetical protein [Clostridia bacterium]